MRLVITSCLYVLYSVQTKCRKDYVYTQKSRIIAHLRNRVNALEQLSSRFSLRKKGFKFMYQGLFLCTGSFVERNSAYAQTVAIVERQQ